MTKQLKEKLAFWTFRILSLFVVGVLFWILYFIFIRGWKSISWEFLTSMPEDGMTAGGIYPAIIGTLCLMVGSMLFSFPIGIMAGIYLNEYMKDSWFKRFVKMMTNNLAGVPSIVFGLFGMSLFVNTLEFGDSILAGSLTLSLLALPVVIRVTEEALLAVDQSFRQEAWHLARPNCKPSAGWYFRSPHRISLPVLSFPSAGFRAKRLRSFLP